MPTDSIADQLKDMLVNNWALAAPIAVADIHFDIGWYDARKSEYPQVTVSPLFPLRDIEYFGESLTHVPLHFIAREIYVVNLWIRVDAGREGDIEEEEQIEDMREEVVRILTTQWKSFAAPLGAVLPRNRGRNLSVIDKQARQLRFEIEVQVNIRE